MKELIYTILVVGSIVLAASILATYIHNYKEKKCNSAGGELGSHGTCFKKGTIIHMNKESINEQD